MRGEQATADLVHGLAFKNLGLRIVAALGYFLQVPSIPVGSKSSFVHSKLKLDYNIWLYKLVGN